MWAQNGILVLVSINQALILLVRPSAWDHMTIHYLRIRHICMLFKKMG